MPTSFKINKESGYICDLNLLIISRQLFVSYLREVDAEERSVTSRPAYLMCNIARAQTYVAHWNT